MTAPVPRVLWIGDDPLAALRFDALQRAGFELLRLDPGAGALHGVRAVRHDAIVLDGPLLLSERLETVRVLRQASAAPLLVLAALGDEIDQILVLEMGADDLLDTSVGARLLVARLQGLLRRGAGSARRLRCATVGPLQIDLLMRCATLHGRRLALRASELELLHELALHDGRPVPREQLRLRLRGGDGRQHERTVDVLLSRLRRSLRLQGVTEVEIVAVPGFGYCLAPTSAEPPREGDVTRPDSTRTEPRVLSERRVASVV